LFPLQKTEHIAVVPLNDNSGVPPAMRISAACADCKSKTQIIRTGTSLEIICFLIKIHPFLNLLGRILPSYQVNAEEGEFLTDFL